jgi:two-component system nitrogen regulation response regulator NtrX
VQARLARLLRDREAVVVESGDTVGFDVRPIASVHSGFDHAMEGSVRDDLFRRISVIHIEMPALRNRREDIPVLANCFLREVCASERLSPKTLSRPALALLSALPWRGNATELRVLLEGIARALPDSKHLGIEDLLTHVNLDGGSVVFSSGGTLRQARARFERDYVAAALERHRGRISETARALGIQRTNLYRKMRTLCIKTATDS